MKKIQLLSILAAFVCIFVSCKKQVQQEEEMQEKQSSYCLSDTAAVYELQRDSIVEQITLTGKIDYNQNDLVAFSSLIEGVIENIYFELGDEVKKGQVLANVRSSQIQDIIQQRKIYTNQLSLLQNQLTTKNDLLKDGLSSLPEIQSTQNEIENTKIEIQKIDQMLQLFSVNSSEGVYQILAPKNGFIVQKNVSIGQNIHAGTDPLFAISNLNKIWVMVNIYANNLRYIKQNDVVAVRTMAYPDKIYKGKINKIYNSFDDNEHVLKARVELDNLDMSLVPGLSADIIIDKDNAQETGFAIPNKAIVFSNNKQYVIVYKSACNLEVQQVRPKAQNELYTYVTTGFQYGDRVVTENALLLFEELEK